MLDPDWSVTRPVLTVVLVVVVALLVLRAVRADRGRYRRFRLARSTVTRQNFYRQMLRDSVLHLGFGSLAVLLLAGAFVAPLADELGAWPPVAAARAAIAGAPWMTAGILAVLAAAIVGLTAVGVRAARAEGIAAIGDVAALLPRNRQELRFGWVLSLNAGISEELLLRLAVPALLFGVSGSAVVAVVVSVALFGALHVYQGWSGVLATTVVGAVLMALYAISGTILVPIIVHVLLDLRSLVAIPIAVNRVDRIDAATPTAPTPRPAPAPASPAASPPTR